MNLLSFLKPKQAFTIIELLVVVGIISILAIALLVTLNPTEAQKKSRDAKRVKDATTIQAIIESFLSDGGDTFCTTICTSIDGSATANSQPCTDAGWLGEDLGTDELCDYAQSIPSDPINLAGRSCAIGTATTESTGCGLVYYFQMSGSNYEINVAQESVDNRSKLVSDPGTNPYFVEIISSGTTEIISDATQTNGVAF